MGWRLSTYRMLVGIGLREATVYRTNFLMGIVNVLVQVFMLSVVWTAVYRGRADVDGVALPTMLAYVTLISVQTWVLNNTTFSRVPDRVRLGQIAYDITRPIGLLGQLFARQVGNSLAIGPFVVVALVLGAVVGEMRGPSSVSAGLAYGLSIVLAYVICTCAMTIIGLFAFWTLEVRGIAFVYRTVSTFFAGGLVPLWFMPGWLRTTAEALPFQATAYTPVSIYLGRLTGTDLWSALGLQVFWCVALGLFAYAVWRRALHKVVIQGG